MKLTWSERAQADVVEIARYIGTDNRSAAAAWLKKVSDRAQLVREFPQSGRIVPEYSKDDLREVLMDNYRIVYLVSTKAIVIVTVFERHRQFPEK